MSDRAPRMAEFFIATPGMSNNERHTELNRRFPGFTDEELRRGIEIAQELLRAEAGEYFVKAEAFDKAARKGGAS